MQQINLWHRRSHTWDVKYALSHSEGPDPTSHHTRPARARRSGVRRFGTVRGAVAVRPSGHTTSRETSGRKPARSEPAAAARATPRERSSVSAVLGVARLLVCRLLQLRNGVVEFLLSTKEAISASNQVERNLGRTSPFFARPAFIASSSPNST